MSSATSPSSSRPSSGLAALRRLVSSILGSLLSELFAILVVDDSAGAAGSHGPEGISRYWHLPFNSAGLAGGGETSLSATSRPEYVLVTDDDMVFGRKTDLGKLLETLQTTPFDVVSCGLDGPRPVDGGSPRV